MKTYDIPEKPKGVEAVRDISGNVYTNMNAWRAFFFVSGVVWDVNDQSEAWGIPLPEDDLERVIDSTGDSWVRLDQSGLSWALEVDPERKPAYWDEVIFWFGPLMDPRDEQVVGS